MWTLDYWNVHPVKSLDNTFVFLWIIAMLVTEDIQCCDLINFDRNYRSGQGQVEQLTQGYWIPNLSSFRGFGSGLRGYLMSSPDLSGLHIREPRAFVVWPCFTRIGGDFNFEPLGFQQWMLDLHMGWPAYYGKFLWDMHEKLSGFDGSVEASTLF